MDPVTVVVAGLIILSCPLAFMVFVLLGVVVLARRSRRQSAPPKPRPADALVRRIRDREPAIPVREGDGTPPPTRHPARPPPVPVGLQSVRAGPPPDMKATPPTEEDRGTELFDRSQRYYTFDDDDK
jgi:hypothetical protein